MLSNPLHCETALGTALIVHKSIQPYIYNINSLPGSAIYIDFFFPNNNKIRVISVYLPTNHPQLLKSTQSLVNIWLNEAKTRNWHSIVLGDFNANERSNKKQFPIFSSLSSNNLSSLLSFHNITDFT